jgi:hypothetical protein
MTGDLAAELLKLPDWNGARVLQDMRFLLGFSLKISKNILRAGEAPAKPRFRIPLGKLGQTSGKDLMTPEKF